MGDSGALQTGLKQGKERKHGSSSSSLQHGCGDCEQGNAAFGLASILIPFPHHSSTDPSALCTGVSGKTCPSPSADWLKSVSTSHPRESVLK